MNIDKMSIRPKLELLPGKNDIETFQNEVLRPIIKLQHDILIRIFEVEMAKFKSNFLVLDEVKKTQLVLEKFKVIAFKKLLVGIIVGHFQHDELELYLTNAQEFDRRIVTMISQKVLKNYFLVK
jgi:hypothetical protein